MTKLPARRKMPPVHEKAEAALARARDAQDEARARRINAARATKLLDEFPHAPKGWRLYDIQPWPPVGLGGFGLSSDADYWEGQYPVLRGECIMQLPGQRTVIGHALGLAMDRMNQDVPWHILPVGQWTDGTCWPAEYFPAGQYPMFDVSHLALVDRDTLFSHLFRLPTKDE